MISQTIQERYLAVLEKYLHDPHEQHLLSCADIGRELVKEKAPLEEVAELHELAISQLLENNSQEVIQNTWSLLFSPLMELMVGYGLAFREEEERRVKAEEKLQETYHELERRVAERTEELFDANRRLQEEISERKKAEEKSKQHLAELSHAARVVTLGEMATGIAHELNQPLTAIVNYADACSSSLADPSNFQKEHLQTLVAKISDQAYRSGEIIRHMRSLVRKTSPHRSEVDINDRVVKVSQLFDNSVRTMGIQWTLELAEPAPKVFADGLQIEQVLLNLIQNSLDALTDQPDGHRKLFIKILFVDNKQIQVSIKDSGRPPSAKDLEKIFDAFFTTKPQGIGMGLAISRSIIDAHGGKLWVAESLDHGTEFFFTLPVLG